MRKINRIFVLQGLFWSNPEFMAKNNEKYISRELSWLSFNERVLQEAADKTVPLIERVKFLGIFSNNQDEFFRVRVATLNRMAAFKKQAKELIGENPNKLLRKIHDHVIELQQRFENIYQEILRELEAEKIFIVNERQLNKEQKEFVKQYFLDKVEDTLVPIMIDTAPKFPYLRDKAIYFAIKMHNGKNAKKNVKYSLIQIPSNVLPRFVTLPKIGDNNYIMLLDDIIRFNLKSVFSIFDYSEFEAYTIKMTRDAELELDNDLSKSITEKISKGLKARKKGKPVRFVFDNAIPKDLLNFITKKINLQEENLIPGGRYHNFKDFIKFPKVGSNKLANEPMPPLMHPDFDGAKSLLSVIRKKDVLLSFPYQSYSYIVDILREASIDPQVTSIKITLYRVAENSNIIWALTNAVKNGKQVTVVVELQARFDEEANIYWANQLQEEGATVIYGVPGLKVHSKLFIITRKEKDKHIDYVHVGTGNFNESTATIYSDYSLLTCDKRITEEANKIFIFFGNNFKTGNYKHLLVSPFYMRKKISQMLSNEVRLAKEGKEAWCIIKLNSLADHEMTQKIYRAAQEGVKIKLIIRGSCSLIPPDSKSTGDNLQIISIVDRFLEHARVMIFNNNGDVKYYISSADWMLRNFDQRTEVACPIYDKSLQQTIRDMIDMQLSDNIKARIIDGEQSNRYKKPKSLKKNRSQNEIYNYFKARLRKQKAGN